MRATPLFVLALALGLLAVADRPAHAQASGSKPATLWKFLGIPQGIHKSYDSLINRTGKHPGLERKPPLKALADPLNLESDNPAIKAAAEIKQQEDLKAQKIKAIRYLSQVACGCYPQVKQALLAALDDCTEEVRYEAAVAFCKASGNPCSLCNGATCCDPAVKKKLAEMAYGTDANGCFKEPSSRVRAAAKLALNACDRIPTMAPTEGPRKEGPTELEFKEGEQLRGLEAPMPPQSTPAPGLPSPSENETTSIFNPVSLPSGEIGQGSQAKVATVSCPRCHEMRCGPGRCGCGAYAGPGTLVEPGATDEGATSPAPDVGELEDLLDSSPTSPSPNALAGTFGATRGLQSATPYMIGDQFGRAGSLSSVVQSYSFSGLSYNFDDHYTYDGGTRIAYHGPPPPNVVFPLAITDYNDDSGRIGTPGNPSVPSGGSLVSGETTYDDFAYNYTSNFDVRYYVPVINPGSGGVVGKMKIAENTNPMPRDRFICDYTYYDGVPLYPGGVNVNRLTVGFEKTFFDGQASFEMKAPMASTLSSGIAIGETPDFTSGEFGNMLFTVKGILLQTRKFAFSGGLSVAVPTAAGTSVSLDGQTLIEIHNESTHLAPFLGALWTPNDKFFAQAFLQYDVDSNGNPVFLDSGSGLAFSGRLNDSTDQYCDIGIGRWIYRSRRPTRGISAVALTAEMHWNLALQDEDYIQSGNFTIGQPATNVEVVNAVVGAHFRLNRTMLTLAYGTPMGGGMDQEFDGEFRVMLNYDYGRTSLASRAPSTY